MLQHCEDLPIAEFTKIETVLPVINVKGLSTDQKYLLEIRLAVKQGCAITDLANKQPGKVGTLSLTTCGDYRYPSQNLIKLAKFVTTVYAPTGFSTLKVPSCKHGPSHILDMIRRCFIWKRNADFAHPTNVLLAMLQGERQYAEKLALRRILKARKTTKSEKVREFLTPNLNLEAIGYYKLIDWTTESSDPPFTSKYSKTEIWDQIMNKNISIPIEKLPCHTQAVERGVDFRQTRVGIFTYIEIGHKGFLSKILKSDNNVLQLVTRYNLLTKPHRTVVLVSSIHHKIDTDPGKKPEAVCYYKKTKSGGGKY
nr:unnamed protein product [Callosobruchus analis]